MYVHAYVYVYMYTFIHIYTHTCIHVCMHTYIHMCVYIYTVYIYIYGLRTYIHTCIQTDCFAGEARTLLEDPEASPPPFKVYVYDEALKGSLKGTPEGSL